MWQISRKKKLEKDDTKKEPDWITVNGVHIPIKPGQNKDDVVKNFLDKQKDKEPKKDTPKKDDKPKSGDVYNTSSYNNNDGKIEITVDKMNPKFFRSDITIEEYENYVSIGKDIWNDISDTEKSNIENLKIGLPNKQSKNASGTFDPNSKTIGLHLDNIRSVEGKTTEVIKGAIASVLTHEIAHSQFHLKAPVTQSDWSSDVLKEKPITEYLKKFRKTYEKARQKLENIKFDRNILYDELDKIDKQIKSGKLSDKSNDPLVSSPLERAEKRKASLERDIEHKSIMYNYAVAEEKDYRITYGNETHSEYKVMEKGHTPLWKSDKEVFNKLKPIYDNYFGGKN